MTRTSYSSDSLGSTKIRTPRSCTTGTVTDSPEPEPQQPEPPETEASDAPVSEDRPNLIAMLWAARAQNA